MDTEFNEMDELSLGEKIVYLNDLDGDDLTEWENGFITDIMRKTKSGTMLGYLTEKQKECILRIWDKQS